MIAGVVDEYTASEAESEWDLGALVLAMENLYGTGVAAEELAGLEREAIVAEFLDDALDVYAEKEKEIEGIHEGLMRDLERFIVLQTVDTRWREHLESMDYMREGIHLRGMAQKDPLVEYRNEGHLMFLDLSRVIREEVIALLYHAQIEATGDGTDGGGQLPAAGPNGAGGGNGGLNYDHQSLAGADAIAAAGGVSTAAVAGGGSVATRPRVKSEHENVGRNDPCWCGSGKKFERVRRHLGRAARGNQGPARLGP